jgi:hypothetical protein
MKNKWFWRVLEFALFCKYYFGWSNQGELYKAEFNVHERKNSCRIVVNCLSTLLILNIVLNNSYFCEVIHIYIFLIRTLALIYRHSVGLLGRGIGPSQGLYLYTGLHNTEKCRQTSMAWVGFEPTVPVTKRQKAHASDRAATADPRFCFGKINCIATLNLRLDLLLVSSQQVLRPEFDFCVLVALRWHSCWDKIELNLLRRWLWCVPEMNGDHQYLSRISYFPSVNVEIAP